MQSDRGLYGIPRRSNPPRAILRLDGGAGDANGINFTIVTRNEGYCFDRIVGQYASTAERYYVREDGMYAIQLKIRSDNASDDFFILKNNDTNPSESDDGLLAHVTETGSNKTLNLFCITPLVAGDFIKFYWTNIGTASTGTAILTKISE